jgi:type I restriction enzyme S subunit
LVKKSDLIYTRTGQVGLIFKSREGIVHNNCFTITPDSKVDKEYVYWFLKTPFALDYAKKVSAGSSQPDLPHSAFKSMPFWYPNKLVQQKIASILSAYDDLIENNTRRIKILEEMAQTLYSEWFVKFRFPGFEQVQMVESELGLIPEGWEVRKLGDVVELAYGKALRANDRLGGSIVVYGSGGIIGYHNQCLVKAPGIIVGRKGSVGTVFWSDEDFYPIDTVYYVKTKLSLSYIYFNLQTQNFINNDAAVPGLNRNQAYSLPFIVPSEKLLNQFQNFVSPIFVQLKNLRNKNSNLRQTRDLLLPKLISGEIDVESLDIDTKPVTEAIAA